MREVTETTARAGGGLDGDIPSSVKRGITLLSAAQWKDVREQLEADLPWHTRRANLLVEAESLASLIGRTIRIGEVRVQVHAETKPCGLMDELHDGLRAALEPECRGGVYGAVLDDGPIAVGDAVAFCE